MKHQVFGGGLHVQTYGSFFLLLVRVIKRNHPRWGIE